MNLKVYIPRLNDVLITLPEQTSDSQNYLRSLLHKNVQVIIGADLPIPPDYQVLVDGRPTKEQLDASSRLHSLIIPFAGLPEGTRELVKNYPHLRIHNLHHNAETTAEMAVALMLSAAKLLVPYDKYLRQGNWNERYDRASGSVRLYGKTALILGYGNIGRHIAKVCKGLGMRVLAARRNQPEDAHSDGVAEVHPISELHKLLLQANVLILALPLTPETNGLIGERELNLLPDGAVLVNISRGKIVDEAALYHTLKNGKLHSAGIDVWYNYPRNDEEQSNTLPSQFSFHELENVVMSPHRGGDALEIEQLRMEHLAKLLNALAQGDTEINRVNVRAGY
ncbi:hydroxyacid dehydrogenase [Candidatus Acetothermia bacterium]|nr:hydroxyacid dehydrogenase [Candidatus Acetothermia bacterium]